MRMEDGKKYYAAVIDTGDYRRYRKIDVGSRKETRGMEDEMDDVVDDAVNDVNEHYLGDKGYRMAHYEFEPGSRSGMLVVCVDGECDNGHALRALEMVTSAIQQAAFLEYGIMTCGNILKGYKDRILNAPIDVSVPWVLINPNSFGAGVIASEQRGDWLWSDASGAHVQYIIRKDDPVDRRLNSFSYSIEAATEFCDASRNCGKMDETEKSAVDRKLEMIRGDCVEAGKVLSSFRRLS